MLIKDIQLLNEKEKIINDTLTSGIEPSLQLVNQMLNDYMNNNILDLPLFRGFNIKSHSVSNKEEWNDNFYNLVKDLYILYEATSNIKENILEKENILNSYRQNIINELNTLLITNYDLINILNKNYINNTYTFAIGDLYKVQLDKTPVSNLPCTSSFIDLLNKRVINNKVTNTDKININNSKVSISYTGNKINEYGSINSIFNDSNNDYMIYINNDSNECTLKIHIELPNDTKCSAASVILKNINHLESELILYCADGDIKNIKANYFNENYEWSFSECTIHSFDIILNKITIDGVSEYNKNTFLFDIVNISLYMEYYETSSTFVQGEHLLDKLIGEVNIIPNENIPVDTNITYFAGINNGTDLIKWVKLNKNTFTDIKILDNNRSILNARIDNYGKEKNKLYYIGKIKDNTNENSITLYSGYQQWLCTSLGSEEFDVNYTIDINSYNKNKIIDECYIDYESYDFTIHTNKLIILTTTLICDNDTVDEDNEIKLINSNLDLQTVLYVNNTNIVKQDNGKYNIPLTKGKNNIILMLYVGSVVNELLNIEFNINFKRITKKVYCGSKMKKVNMRDLKYLNKSNKYFAVDGNDIYINFNPLTKGKYFYSKDIVCTNIYEENSKYINYSSGWANETINSDLTSYENIINGVYSVTPGASMKFDFKGTTLHLYNDGSLNNGICRITIDDRQYCVETATGDNKKDTVFFSTGTLQDTIHHCKVEVLSRSDNIVTTTLMILTNFVNNDNKISINNNNGITCNNSRSLIYSSFTGNKIVIYGSKGSNYGTIRVIIDTTVYDIDCNSTTEESDIELLSVDNIEQGTHSIQVQIANTSVKDSYHISKIYITDSDTETVKSYKPAYELITKTGKWYNAIEYLDPYSASIKYSGDWINEESNAYEYGKIKYTSTKDSYFEFTFTGEGFEWYGKTNDWKGIADIYIDGNLYTSVDCYNSIENYNYMYFSKYNLLYKQHTVKIVCSGRKNDSSANCYINITKIIIFTNIHVDKESMKTMTKGGYMEFNFIGTGVNVIGYTNTYGYIAKFYLDDNLIDTRRIYDTTTRETTLILLKNLERKTHKLKIELDTQDHSMYIKDIFVYNGIIVSNPLTSLSGNMIYLKGAIIYNQIQDPDNENILVAGRYKAHDKRLHYDTNWIQDITGLYDTAKVKYTNNTNCTASFKFYGNEIKIIGYKSNHYGIMQIKVDNNIYLVDLYDENTLSNQTIFKLENLDLKVHEVVITSIHQKNPKSSRYTVLFDKIIINGIMLNDVNFQDYCRFNLQYKSLKKSCENLLIDGNKLDLRIMAILQSNNNTVTPQLFSYNIETK